MFDESVLREIEKFRSELLDVDFQNEYYSSDSFLYKFLKAQKMDMHKARSTLINSLDWRKGYEGILEWDPPKLLCDLVPYKFLDEDFKGRPIIYSSNGKWDIKRAIKEYDRETYIKYFCQMLFRIEDRVRTSSKAKNLGCISIGNFTGFSMSQLTAASVVSATIETTKSANEYFPGLYDVNILLNMTRFSEMFLKIIRPFFSEEFSQGLKTFGCDEAKYKPECIKYLPVQELPKELGGLKV